MRALNTVFLALILAVAACRTIPSDVSGAHAVSMTESKAAFVIAEDLMTDIEEKSSELNDQSVTAAHKEWKAHIVKIAANRSVVQEYLVQEKLGELNDAYRTGNILFVGMNRGMTSISKYWKEMLDPTRAASVAQFSAMFRKDIARYKELDRKFNDWIIQFKVKG